MSLRTRLPFLILSFSLLYSRMAVNAQPLLRVENLVQTVEVTSNGGEVTKEVSLSNSGTQTLKLKVEKTSCGCTGAILSAELLAPGQTATLTIKMQVSGWGTKTETVTLSTNDPKQPQPVITLQAKMPATVVPNPARLMMQTQEGEATQRFLSLLLPDKATVTQISTRNAYVRAKTLDSHPIDGGTLQRIEVMVGADAAAGELKDELTIELKDAPVPQIGVAVEGFITPDISVEPHQIFLGQVPQGTTLRKIVVVQSHAKRPFSVAKIETTRQGVSGKADPRVVAAAHAVEIDVTAQGVSGSFVQDAVRMTLSNGRVLEVPVVGMIVKPNATTAAASPTAAVRVGSPAPDFAVTDMNGNPRKLTDLSGRKNLLLTFFPKCFTGGCAGHLASLQQELSKFARADTEVWAVSVDGPADQLAFAAKLGLQFPLLPDAQRQLSMLYGATQNKSDLAARQSVLIDKTGVVRWIDTDVRVQTHGADVLSKMRELRMNAP